jgi:hypothetical protein
MHSTVETRLTRAGAHRVLQESIQLLQSTCVFHASPELLTIRLNMEAGGNEKNICNGLEFSKNGYSNGIMRRSDP